jgi:hypothetical protein
MTFLLYRDSIPPPSYAVAIDLDAQRRDGEARRSRCRDVNVLLPAPRCVRRPVAEN